LKSVKSVNAVKMEQGVTLIKPGVDASDKEMHMRNKFSHISTNLMGFMHAAYKDSDL
jgi:hypothetical protein